MVLGKSKSGKRWGEFSRKGGKEGTRLIGTRLRGKEKAEEKVLGPGSWEILVPSNLLFLATFFSPLFAFLAQETRAALALPRAALICSS
ncbi:hypothetical protein AUQ44_07270 [Vibrio cidicii]|uniref:Uncharacterized protein n=1 Tax=Vibrio cidicii TaxID=1763883 RepID=A0A151JI82_9VIBR|nr:hypothetical protein AUQ44_07270 [Vibrio cidicii]